MMTSALQRTERDWTLRKERPLLSASAYLLYGWRIFARVALLAWHGVLGMAWRSWHGMAFLAWHDNCSPLPRRLALEPRRVISTHSQQTTHLMRSAYSPCISHT